MPAQTIAVTAEDGNGLKSRVCRCFGKSPFYVVVKVEDGKMTRVDTGVNRYLGGHQLGLIPSTHGIGVNVVLTGGMEPRVVGMFNDLGIRVVTDLEGEVGQVIDAYLTSPSS